MLKSIRTGYRKSAPAGSFTSNYGGGGDDDEEAQQNQHQHQHIAEDPDLDSPAAPPLDAAKARVKQALQGAVQAVADPPEPPRAQPYAPPYAGRAEEHGGAWKLLINILIIFPWSLVLLTSFLVNRWQLLWRPLGGALWWCVDRLDRRAPAATEVALWLASQLSLALHVLAVGVTLGVTWIMWANSHRAAPAFVVAAYGFAHYCSAVTMFKELDMREAGDTYFSDVLTLLQRLLDVLFYDIQMVASVVHSNRMLEGMTQVMFKGYEEARVALTALLFTAPCCVVVGVQYGVFNQGKLRTDVRDLRLLTSYQDQLYAAVCLGVINTLEKLLRLSLVDPWMHEKGDGFPLLFVRSHAARLPGSLVRDWLVRCKVALAAAAPPGRLPLRELFAHYSTQVRDTSLSLADPHRAYLLRKAVYFFNTRLRYSRLRRRRTAAAVAAAGGAEAAQRAAVKAEAAAEAAQQAALAAAARGRPMIEDLAADGIAPGPQLSAMLADILSDVAGLSRLSLADNDLDDAAVAGVMAALAGNDAAALTQLDLSGNQILAKGAAAVASVLARDQTLHSLRLARCPLRDEGAMALAEALRANICLFELDLSDSQVGPEGAIALAAALKVNPVLASLSLAGTGIGSVGVEAICKGLRAAGGGSGLKRLDLSRTSLDDRGAAALAALLAQNRTLERLSLADTSLTDAGAQLICNALQANGGALQSVDVSDNAGMDRSWQKLLNHVVGSRAAGTTAAAAAAAAGAGGAGAAAAGSRRGGAR